MSVGDLGRKPRRQCQHSSNSLYFGISLICFFTAFDKAKIYLESSALNYSKVQKLPKLLIINKQIIVRHVFSARTKQPRRFQASKFKILNRRTTGFEPGEKFYEARLVMARTS